MTEDEIAYQALIYKCTSALLRYPDKDVAPALDELSGLFEDASQEVECLEEMRASYYHIEQEESLDLERDYTALFIGALKMLAPPYASYYLDGQRQLNGPSTLKVLHAYDACGLDHSPKRNQPADHIATMLEYLFELLRRSLADTDRRDTLVDDARMFFKNLLLPWIEPFSDSIICNAKTAFYANLGRLLPEILIADSLLIEPTD